MVNILIVDDHSLMRRAVREVLEKEEDMTVVAEASNGYEAEVQAAQTQPDVVLMDVDWHVHRIHVLLSSQPITRKIIYSKPFKRELWVTLLKILNQMH
jgi:DNA-binding NarL/FixJ family response regulator